MNKNNIRRAMWVIPASHMPWQTAHSLYCCMPDRSDTKIYSWNVRGLNKLVKLKQILGRLKKKMGSKMVFLQQTQKVNTVNNNLYFTRHRTEDATAFILHKISHARMAGSSSRGEGGAVWATAAQGNGIVYSIVSRPYNVVMNEKFMTCCWRKSDCFFYLFHQENECVKEGEINYQKYKSIPERILSLLWVCEISAQELMLIWPSLWPASYRRQYFLTSSASRKYRPFMNK